MPRAPLVLAPLVLLAVAACIPATPPSAPTRATGPVEVPVPPVGSQARTTCARLTAALPDALGPDLPRRPVTPDPARAAAWGDPALVLRCGVAPAGRPGIDGEPVTLGPPDGRLLEFLVDDVGAASRFTTRDRRVPVEVTVPDAYDAQAVQALIVPLLDTVPER